MKNFIRIKKDNTILSIKDCIKVCEQPGMGRSYYVNIQYSNGEKLLVDCGSQEAAEQVIEEIWQALTETDKEMVEYLRQKEEIEKILHGA